MARVVCFLSVITVVTGAAGEGPKGQRGRHRVAIVVLGKLHLMHFPCFFRCHSVPLKGDQWTPFAKSAGRRHKYLFYCLKFPYALFC
jgi:hypothetical protein